MKVVRLIVGIDDSNRNHLVLLPRLPLGWKALHASNYPASVEDQNTMLDYRFERTENSGRFNLKSSLPLPALTARLGPLKPGDTMDNLKVNIEGTTGTVAIKTEGSARWLYFTSAGPARTAQISYKSK